MEIGAVKLDSGTYRQAALETRKQTGKLLLGVEIVPEREHFGIRFSKDSGEGEGDAVSLVPTRR